MKRRSVALVGCWLAVVGALGCEARDPTPAGRGARIFVRTCAGCHGADGRGTLRPGLSRPPRDLTKPDFQAQISNEQLRHSIRIGKGQMPAFGGLMGEEEIADVIAFVRTLVPPGTVPASLLGPSAPPPSPPAPGALAAPSGAPLASPATAQGAQ
jgi:mono/diheme cytochrome c family protein